MTPYFQKAFIFSFSPQLIKTEINKAKQNPLHSLSEMQIKLPNEEQAEGKYLIWEFCQTFTLMNFRRRDGEDIKLEMQKQTQHSWQEHIVAYCTKRVNLKCKLELY